MGDVVSPVRLLLVRNAHEVVDAHAAEILVSARVLVDSLVLAVLHVALVLRAEAAALDDLAVAAFASTVVGWAERGGLNIWAEVSVQGIHGSDTAILLRLGALQDIALVLGAIEVVVGLAAVATPEDADVLIAELAAINDQVGAVLSVRKSGGASLRIVWQGSQHIRE